ncbi:MAG: LamG-like jellyroll fold domain-containing protein, partial [Verrucomicrobiota bacterium]
GLNGEENANPMMIGENPDARGRTWEGMIDEVTIWNRVLNEAEVTELFTSASSIGDLLVPPVFEFDFNDGVPEGVELTGTAEVRDSGGVDDSGYLKVTDAENSQLGAVIFPDISGGTAVKGFKFSVDVRSGGGTDRPADGFSMNLVRPNDPLLTGDPRGATYAGIGNETSLPEEGSRTGFGLGFDEWESGAPDIVGISVRVDNDLIVQVPAPTLNGEADDPTSLQTGPQPDGGDSTENLTWQKFEVVVDENDAGKTEITVNWKGTEIVKEEILFPGGALIPVFGGRTGGANANHHFDNMRLELIKARLAALTGYKGRKDLVQYRFIDGPESQVVRESIVITVNGAEVEAVLDDDGQNIIANYIPPQEFEGGQTIPVSVTAMDTVGNTFTRSDEIVIPPSGLFGGGTFTVRHFTEAGSIEAVDEVLSGAATPPEDITISSTYVHFHDNSGPPLFADESEPYPLWGPQGDNSGFGDRNAYGIHATGNILMKEPGTYHFVCNSDDGFRLIVDGENVGEAGDRGRGNTFMPVDLSEGEHSIDFAHWENGGGAGVSLYVSRAPAGEQPTFNATNYQLVEAFDITVVVTEDTDGDGMDDFKENFYFGDLSRDGTGDEDGDGLNDADELALFASPIEKDSDGDGIEDGPEVELGTDPANADTDGDTIADGTERDETMTDPNDADS